jgi:cell division septal protein FtsQ
VTRDTLQIPTARSWRDIPQPVVPRAMSREGRWRMVMSSLRIAAFVAVCTGIVWGVWLVFVSLDENTKTTTSVAQSTPLKAPELRTDGVLDNAWLAGVLALPKNASLTELDLEKLRSRLLADRQLVTATLTRRFPDRLLVQITERAPVARVTAEAGGQQHVFLVARDGVVYNGKNYDPTMLDTLPWLDGVELVGQNGGFRPIEGMAAVAELLAKARLEAEHLYGSWIVVSLAHLDADHQIEVRTKRGPCIIYFTTRDDYFRQLAKLNYIWEQLMRLPEAKATIDLSLGSDVPVMVDTPVDPNAPPAHAAVTASKQRPVADARSMFASQRTLSVFSHPQPNKNKREL